MMNTTGQLPQPRMGGMVLGIEGHWSISRAGLWDWLLLWFA